MDFTEQTLELFKIINIGKTAKTDDEKHNFFKTLAEFEKNNPSYFTMAKRLTGLDVIDILDKIKMLFV